VALYASESPNTLLHGTVTPGRDGVTLATTLMLASIPETKGHPNLVAADSKSLLSCLFFLLHESKTPEFRQTYSK